MKNFYLLFSFILAFTLLASKAQAQITPEVFIEKTTQWLQADELVKIARGVRFEREAGQKAFEKMLESYRAQPSDSGERWLNAIARAFRMEGLDGPNQALAKEKILWPTTRWNGTVFEADQVVDTRGTVAKNLPPSGKSQGDSFESALAATQLAVRVGNSQAVQPMLAALKAHLKKHPNHPLKGQVLALEVNALETVGLWNEALSLGSAVLPQLEGEPELWVRLAMISSARKLERPTELDRLLKETEPLAKSVDSAVAQFIIESLQFERANQREELSLEELTRQHVAVWRHLKNPDLESIPGGLGRQTVEAAGAWVNESLTRMQEEAEEFPVRAQLYYIVWEDLNKLRRLGRSQMAMQFQPSEAQAFLKLWNPEFMIATQALELHTVASWRESGQKEYAALLLSELEASVQETWELIREAGLGYQLAHYGNPVRLEGQGFEFVWTLGEAPRMVALQRMETARLRNDDLAIDEAIDFQKDARRENGFLGLEDARFLRLEKLLKKPLNGQAEALNKTLLGLSEEREYRPGIIVCKITAAEIASKKGSKKLARAEAEKAVVLIEEYLAERGGDRRMRNSFRRAYELLAELQLEAGLNEEAFATLARLGQAETLLNRNPKQFGKKRPELRRAFRELETTRSRSRALQESKQKQEQAGQNAGKTEQLIAENKSEFYRSLGNIRRQYPGYGNLLAVRPVNFSRLQKHVPKNTSVIQIFPAKDALFLFVLTAQELKIKKVPVGSEEIFRLAKDARSGLLSSKHRSLRNRAGRALKSRRRISAEESLEAFVKLHKYIVEPIESEIAKSEVVAFIPSGALMSVPLQAMARKSGEKFEFLIERKQVVTLFKSSDLENLARRPQSGASGTLLVGNPDGSLPGATEEAKSIASFFPKSKVLLGDQATLSKVKANSQVEYIHLATHGILNREDPNLSYLVLGEGQKLDIGEIAGMDLSKVRMVTLSACETALGEEVNSQGELTSLADAFGFAGCPTVTASLWKVSDDSTKLLMNEFYQGLKKKQSPAEAFQQAQKALINQKRTNHPYHWAAFLLIGDWRKS